MNRRKKLKQIFKKKDKAKKAKLNPKAKPLYISKAEQKKAEEDTPNISGE